MAFTTAVVPSSATTGYSHLSTATASEPHALILLFWYYSLFLLVVHIFKAVCQHWRQLKSERGLELRLKLPFTFFFFCRKDWDVVALGVHDLTFMSTPPIPVAEVIDFQGGASFPPAFDLSLIRLDSPVRFGRDTH